MSGGGGGGGYQSSTSTNNSVAGPPPSIAPKLESVLNDVWGWYRDNAKAPAYYPGATVAPMSLTTQGALSALSTRGMNGTAEQAAGKSAILDTLTGKYLDINNNPYFQGAIKASFEPQMDNLLNRTLPTLDSKFAGSGRTGSGAHFDTSARTINDLNQTQSDAAAKAALGAYTGERSNMQASLGMLPSFQAMDYQNLNAALSSGQLQDAYNQRVIDSNVARYNYANTAQADWYARMAGLLQGMYPGGQNFSSGMSSGYTQQAGGGSGVGTAMGLAGLGLQAYTAFSDARLKDVKARVGYTDDGLPLYLYKYKGDDRPQIGPMAQDVAKVKPDAVKQHESGYLQVDYSKLAPAGGLL